MTDRKFDYRKLRGRIVEKYGTQGAFSKAVKLSENSVSRKINGIKSFSREDILRWCELLDIDRDDIGIYFFTQKVR